MPKTYTLEKTDTSDVYKTIHTEIQYGSFKQEEDKKVALLFETEAGLVPGFRYNIYEGVEGLTSTIILFEFTTITKRLIDKNGVKSY